MATISLDNVCVDYPIYNLEARSLKKELFRFSTGGRFHHEKNSFVVRGLDHVNLTIEHGDRVGLLGHNGAGKSTMLRLLAGIYEPTVGHIHVDGKVTTLFNIMLGMDEEATGYENIINRGVMMGLSRKAIQGKIEDIAAFTELGDYLKVPMRTYSAGMRVRLGFAVVTCIAAEILLIDEAVGAGDANFMIKAKKRLDNMINNSSIVVLAIHDISMIERICNKVLILDAGKVKFFGETKEALEIYQH